MLPTWSIHEKTHPAENAHLYFSLLFQNLKPIPGQSVRAAHCFPPRYKQKKNRCVSNNILTLALNPQHNDMLSTSYNEKLRTTVSTKSYYNYCNHYPQKEEYWFITLLFLALVHVVYMSFPAVYSCQGHSPELVWVGNDGFNDVVWAMGIIFARIAELTHAGCRELPLTARQTPREEAEELASGGLFFTAKRMHDTQSALIQQSVELHGKITGLRCAMTYSTSNVKVDRRGWNLKERNMSGL